MVINKSIEKEEKKVALEESCKADDRSQFKKPRREDTDRRQHISKLITILDRRNIQDRRTIKDRRLSTQKAYFTPITHQGVSVKGLVSEQNKLFNTITQLILDQGSMSSSDITTVLRNIYLSIPWGFIPRPLGRNVFSIRCMLIILWSSFDEVNTPLLRNEKVEQ